MDRLALIAGNGQFPIKAAASARDKKIKITAIAFKGETSKKLTQYVDKIYWIQIGEVGRIFSILKDENLKEAIMAGQIRPINLFKPWLKKDVCLKEILERVKDNRGDSLLEALSDELKKRDIRLLDSSFLLKDSLASEGLLTHNPPSQREREDVDFGKQLAKELAKLSIGQTVIIKNKAVLAVESIEGTDAAIKRAAKLGGPGAVVVKASRPNHDMRYDIPVIGLKTLQVMVKCEINVIAVEAEKTLLIDKDNLISKANRLGISILGFKLS
jgi:hypothetical protein